ncbi:phosphate signaling complex protein PhoU [Parasporobacterium paucivorans]|uniref:Phosphate-specific transport system accessory protein PhoU n=1 Tax=Parasporobacterium paucivorans DSM 15970 TaxID=1122934 RepID=A0A1M6D7E3_9FIRM|nr:phosphate signaling complex protein PhoU [Parasporobacterium paucivorans]SHI69120.1 phosphate uptake regulator, PhoU [Parasporobacterium paucivorans DSM 15970]
MRNRFDEQLETLNNELIKMGSLIEYAIEKATDAFITQNNDEAEMVIRFDKEVDDKEKQIEGLCLKLLLQQQPVARDLRQISAALKMITDMERIGDQAADISEIVMMLGRYPELKEMIHIPKMAEATIKMVKESIDAYVKKDLGLAKQVIDYDDVVDDLFVVVKDELIELIRSNVKQSEAAADMLMVAKYYERIGDHATNIAEWVIFSITGEKTI